MKDYTDYSSAQYICAHCGQPSGRQGHLVQERMLLGGAATFEQIVCPKSIMGTISCGRIGFDCHPGHTCGITTDVVISGTHQKTRVGDQPLPIKNDLPNAQDMLITDIEQRKQLGIKRYGTLLQPFNGRDFLRDAYEEAMDLALYLRGLIYERDRK